MRALIAVREDGGNILHSVIFSDAGKALDFLAGVQGEDPTGVNILSVIFVDGCFVVPSAIDGSYNYAQLSSTAEIHKSCDVFRSWVCTDNHEAVANTWAKLHSMMEYNHSHDTLRDCLILLEAEMHGDTSSDISSALQEATDTLEGVGQNFWRRIEHLMASLPADVIALNPLT